jgi:formylglycine-generating enzyme required for sulfatase activity
MARPFKGKIGFNIRDSEADWEVFLAGIPRKVLKGGSHLCAPNYCRRYHPAARHAKPVDTSSSPIGFRCVSRQGSDA